METESKIDMAKTMLANNVTLSKMTTIGLLALLLLIPLALISSLLEERKERRNQAVTNITSGWGREQVIIGPILSVPYKKESGTDIAYFLPCDASVDGTFNARKLYRGIYEAAVYTGSLKLTGTFRPQFEQLKIRAEDLAWSDASVFFTISDMRGTSEVLLLKFGDTQIELAPGCSLPAFPSGVTARINKAPDLGNGIAYALEFKLNGSRSIRFAPIGMQNKVRLSAPWPDPSFCGEFLPSDRTVGVQGFEALWNISYYGRNYPQVWTASTLHRYCPAALTESLFGVEFLTVIDNYRPIERAIKYGLLFIVVILTVFFLFEMSCKLRIHPLQYLLVGLALCLFYLALLSFSEFLDFTASYSIGAGASSLLIVAYSIAVLKSGKRSFGVIFGLAVNYGFLYVILQQQDYSLVSGTMLLFLLLSVIMYSTRNLGQAGAQTK